MSNRNNIEGKRIDAWVRDYAALCQKHGLYLVENDDIWLQEAGDQCDLDDVAANMQEMLGMAVAGYERSRGLTP